MKMTFGKSEKDVLLVDVDTYNSMPVPVEENYRFVVVISQDHVDIRFYETRPTSRSLVTATAGFSYAIHSERVKMDPAELTTAFQQIFSHCFVGAYHAMAGDAPDFSAVHDIVKRSMKCTTEHFASWMPPPRQHL
jgi:hypothetical protein